MSARVTGAVYLLYFVTAIGGQWLVGHSYATLGFAVNLLSAAVYATLTVLLYFLFKPVNARASMLAAAVSLAGCAITVLNLFHLAAHVNPLVFFGPYCLLLGYLILRSGFLPRTLGVLMVLAGLGWLTFLALPLASHLAVYIEALGILAEGSLMLWLLIFGVRVRRSPEAQSVQTSA